MITSVPDRPTAKGLLMGVALYFVVGYHVCEAAFMVAGSVAARVREARAAVAPRIDELTLRHELREIGGLGDETVDTILAAAKAPAPA